MALLEAWQPLLPPLTPLPAPLWLSLGRLRLRLRHRHQRRLLIPRHQCSTSRLRFTRRGSRQTSPLRHARPSTSSRHVRPSALPARLHPPRLQLGSTPLASCTYHTPSVRARCPRRLGVPYSGSRLFGWSVCYHTLLHAPASSTSGSGCAPTSSSSGTSTSRCLGCTSTSQSTCSSAAQGCCPGPSSDESTLHGDACEEWVLGPCSVPRCTFVSGAEDLP
jgi:hypothetical protein